MKMSILGLKLKYTMWFRIWALDVIVGKAWSTAIVSSSSNVTTISGHPMTLSWTHSIQDSDIDVCYYQIIDRTSTASVEFLGWSNEDRKRWDYRKYYSNGWDFINEKMPCQGGIAREETEIHLAGQYIFHVKTVDGKNHRSQGINVTVVTGSELFYTLTINESKVMHNIAHQSALPTLQIEDHGLTSLSISLGKEFPKSNITLSADFEISSHVETLQSCLMSVSCSGNFTTKTDLIQISADIESGIQGFELVRVQQPVLVTDLQPPIGAATVERNVTGIVVVVVLLVVFLLLLIILFICLCDKRARHLKNVRKYLLRKQSGTDIMRKHADEVNKLKARIAELERQPKKPATGTTERQGVLAEEANHPPDVPDLANTPFEKHIYLASDLTLEKRNNLGRSNLEVYESSGSEMEMKNDVEHGMLSSLYVVFLLTKEDSSTDNERREYEITTAKSRYKSLGKEYVIVFTPTDEPIKDRGYMSFERLYQYHEKMDIANVLYHSMFGSRPQPTFYVMQNLGAYCAISFFSGWLKIILPDIFPRCLDQGFVCDADYCKATDHSKCRRIMAPAYFLIIPYSLKGPSDLSEWDEKITDETRTLSCDGFKRGGLKRVYNATVHRLTPDPNEPTKFYRFLAEVPNILINMNDIQECGVGLTAFQRKMAAIQFYKHLDQLIKNDPDCHEKVHFLFFDDTESNYQEETVEHIKKLIEDKINWQNIFTRVIGIIFFNVTQTLSWPQTIKECLNEFHPSQDFPQRFFYKHISETTLPEPLENGSVYYLLETVSPVSWCEGYHVCQTEGYKLAAIQSPLIQDTLKDAFATAQVKKPHSLAWLAARRKDFGSDWSWTIPGLPDFNETFEYSISGYGDFGSVLVLHESFNDLSLYNDKRPGGTENFICSPSGNQHGNHTWFKAQRFCSLSGEHLITLAELDNQQVLGRYAGRYWLGLAHHPWIWVRKGDSYDPVLYNEWANQEMNVTDECLWFRLYDGLWQPSPCDATTSYIICEGKVDATHTTDSVKENVTDRDSETTLHDSMSEIEPVTKQGPTFHQNLLYGAYALGSFIVLLLVIFLAVLYRRCHPQSLYNNGEIEADKPTVRQELPRGIGNPESAPAGLEDFTSTYLTMAESDDEPSVGEKPESTPVCKEDITCTYLTTAKSDDEPSVGEKPGSPPAGPENITSTYLITAKSDGTDYYDDIDLYQSIRDSDIYSDGQQIPTLEQREKMNKQRLLDNEVKAKEIRDTMMYTNVNMEQPSTSQPDSGRMRELGTDTKLIHNKLPYIKKMNEQGFHQKPNAKHAKKKINKTQDVMMYTNVETEKPSTSPSDSIRMMELGTNTRHIHKINKPPFDSAIEHGEPTVHIFCNKSLSSDNSSLDETSRVPCQNSSDTQVGESTLYDDVMPPEATIPSTEYKCHVMESQTKADQNA